MACDSRAFLNVDPSIPSGTTLTHGMWNNVPCRLNAPTSGIGMARPSARVYVGSSKGYSMRVPMLQTLMWCTIVASIASALLLADHGDSGLPLFGSRTERAAPPRTQDAQARPPEHGVTARRSNGHAPTHSRQEDRNTGRGPR